ncbi:MAG: c-type cytochrome [Chitinophagaceae bacterium]
MNNHYQLTRGKIVAFLAFLVLVLLVRVPSCYADANKGKVLFQTNCASCHNPLKDLTGPALYGKENETPGGRAWIYKWVPNPGGMVTTDPYAKALYAKWGPTLMTPFPQLTKQDINDILDYVKQVGDDAKKGGGQAAPGMSPAGQSSSGNNNLLFGILTIVLALVALILMQINSNLHRLANDKEGNPTPDPLPFYRNKAYIAIVVIFLFLLGGYFLTNAAINLGRQQGYQPTQPIFFSHKVHAGINQINCLYCHAGAEKSRQAMIPSPNICMNCHKAISSYSGTPIVTSDGKSIDGTAEIHKLYDYIGWDPQQRKYVRPGKPIEWIKIHNLPDFVYFNHSQHVVVGKIQCQTCHGNIQDMDQVYQFADLSMGWCVNCHRTTKVQFTQNNYYSIFQKFHEELQQGKIDSVTVEMVGGTECQKCHY